jgi:hypothetical protein
VKNPNTYFCIKESNVYKRRQRKPPSKKEQGGKPHMHMPGEQEGMPQHHYCPPAKLAKIGTQNTMMKNNKNTLHDFSPHIPPKTPKGNRSGSTNEMLHSDTTIKTQ